MPHCWKSHVVAHIYVSWLALILNKYRIVVEFILQPVKSGQYQGSEVSRGSINPFNANH